MFVFLFFRVMIFFIWGCFIFMMIWLGSRLVICMIEVILVNW